MPLRKPKADSGAIVVSMVTGILAVDGVRHPIKLGERVRTSHPLVGRYPHLFVGDGLTDQEFHAARQAMLAARA